MSNVSDGVWFAIALIIFVLVTTNVTLWMAWKNRGRTRNNGLFNVMKNDMRSSWKKEEEQIEQLNKYVQQLSNQNEQSERDSVDQS